MRVIVVVGAVILLAATSAPMHAQHTPDDLKPGVPQSLATARAERVSDVRYNLAFNIPANRGDRISARATITFALSDAESPLALDFEPNAMGTLRGVAVAGASITPDLRDGHLVLPPATLRVGSNEVAVDFDAGDAPLNR